MLDTISLVITLCLSLISWLVLQYCGLFATSDMENNLSDSLDESCRSSFLDVYQNFFWIFACIYVLSKITDLSERYLCAHIKSRERICDMRAINDEWERTLKMYESDKEKLAAQISNLRERNCTLEAMLTDLRECNIQLISENYMRTVVQEHQIQGLTQMVQEHVDCPSNIYITNRHIHLTRQVFVNEELTEPKMRESGGEELQESIGPLNVWVQYLKMRKCYMGPIADPNLLLNGNQDSKIPIVMTTEQLAKLQGLM
ncbi:uncharacterized protein LOC115624911 [Scaptodrosophila lebanonensis]|uniref:Uncharacterized protein LOC115624911 n=1 Tax=Drosophila lebanonensis TaxID=7225 RepID=A0A6J2TJI0_DROLE|nr:uncharacterized protein LOC115624911 [Scaptodrosophila lebanonensis]